MPGVVVVNPININDISLGTQTNDIKTTIEVFNAELPAGDNNIGNVDVVTLPNVTLASQANPFTSAIPVSGTFWQATQPISGNVGLNTGNNIIGQVKITDGNLVVSVVADGSINRIQTSTVLTERAQEVKAAGFRKGAIPASTYYVVVDLDNQAGAGPYKHTYTAGQWLYVVGIQGILLKSKPADEWDGRLGVILRIDGTDADIGWFAMGALHARDTSRFESTSVSESFTVPFSLEVVAGDLTDIVLGWIDYNIATINTGITLKDVRDNNVTPQVGDLIGYAVRNGGSGTADLHYGVAYLVA
jgi:hypothetical protein